jgi:acetyl-CoA synthetase/acetyltransferase
VRLNLASPAEVAEAFAGVTRSAGTKEVLVARMIPKGTELILGLARDAQVGLILLVGIGGIFVEIANEVATALAPLAPGEAEKLLAGLSAGRLLDGVRGQKPADRAALIAAIQGLSALAAEIGEAIEEIDVNPIIAGPDGAWAADALVVPRQ